jgi:hypothetical protein
LQTWRECDRNEKVEKRSNVNFSTRRDVMKVMVKVVSVICLIGCIVSYHQNAVAQEMKTPYEPLTLFDGRIRVTGQIDQITHMRFRTTQAERWARQSEFNTFRTNFGLEANYFMVQDRDWELNLTTHLYFSYEWMAQLDSQYKRAMPDYTQRNFLWSRDSEIIRELYLQHLNGPWDIRIGKQQVIWGEQLGIRTLDVINPLDIRTESIGLTDWENIRIGVWMLRGIYDFGDALPGQLSLEGVFIPFDFQPAQIPREGTFFGALFKPRRSRLEPFEGPRNGYLDRLISYRYYRDANMNSINNAEWGIRLRGYYLDFDLDWSIVYFRTNDDSGTWADGGEGGHRADDFFAAWNVRLENVNPPKDIYEFRPYDIMGFSLQRYVGGLIDGVMRFEFVYVYHQYFNKKENDRTDYRGRTPRLSVVTRDSIGWGLQIAKKLPWPQWLPYLYDWSRGKYIDFDIAINQIIWRDYNEAIFDGNTQRGTGFRLNGQLHGKGDNPTTLLSGMIMLHFYDDRIIVVNRYIYYLNSPSLSLGNSISYRPGEHWTYVIGMTQRTGKRDTDPYSSAENKDYLTFQIKYVF